MGRQQVIGSLNYEVIHEDDQGRVWRVTRETVGDFLTVTVSQMGEISFKMNIPDFPYIITLNGIVHLENRKLSITILKGKRNRYKKVIERVDNCEKVRCYGVRFQIYYLNP